MDYSAASNTAEALYHVRDSLDRLAFVQGWTAVVLTTAIAIAFGFKLWKG